MARQCVKPYCCSTARVDYASDDPSYIFKAIYNSANQTVASSVSDNSIKLFTLRESGLSLISNLTGHDNTITELSWTSPAEPNNIHTSSTDGTIRGWDIRTGKQTECYTLPDAEIFSHSNLEFVLCAGTTGLIQFWDRRTGAGLSKLDDTHMDDVTQVKFHPTGRLLSGSTDGLIAVHDVSRSFCDDDGFLAATNINTSVEEIGLYGTSLDRVWIRTGTEGLYLWDWIRGTREESAGGNLPSAEFGDARSVACRALLHDSAIEARGLIEEVEYLVGCHYDADSDQLLLMAGDGNGALGFFSVATAMAAADAGILPLGTRGEFGETGALAPPSMVLTGGHSSVVRSAHCFGTGSDGAPFCVTGGEDSLIALWTMDENAAQATATTHKSDGLAPTARSQGRVFQGKNGGKAKRVTPY
mmetsp:Transcript_9252/g.17334  ORF Transcript_9252/g.17334 Transcript_9252/m.17334 type:complete len:415 (-) Transcript_9252:397-1641(-)